MRVQKIARQLHVGELGSKACAHFAEDATGLPGRVFVELHLACDGVELGVVRGDQAVGRDHAGIGRHDNGGNAELLGDARGMQRARAAERHQRIVAWIAAAFGRDELDGAHDIGVGELQCRRCSLLDAEAKARRQGREGLRACTPHPGRQAVGGLTGCASLLGDPGVQSLPGGQSQAAAPSPDSART